MESLLFYLFRASVIMAIFYGFYKLIFSRNTFHKLNRVLLILIVMITSILPLFSVNILSNINFSETETNLIDLSKFPIIEQIGSYEQEVAFPWIQFLSQLFIAGMLTIIIRYIIGLIQIRKIIVSSEKKNISNNEVLCITDKNISPFSWWSYIVVSRKDFIQDNFYTILSHEKAHVQMNHSMDMALLNLFTILFWFNPFSWLLRREIQTIHEYMADEQLLNDGIDAKQYQYLLIRKSVGEHKFALANNFLQRNLQKRITMMMKTKTKKQMKWNYTFALPILLLALVALSLPKLNANVVSDDPQVKIIGKGRIIDLTKIESDSNSTITHLRGVEKGKQPLLIYNGVKISNEDLKQITPSNIESITVLKDSSAVKLYGEEGADGVIIIVSKDASKEK